MSGDPYRIPFPNGLQRYPALLGAYKREYLSMKSCRKCRLGELMNKYIRLMDAERRKTSSRKP